MELFSIPILQVALSTVICWALFAIMCSMIHESIVQLKSERGRFFKQQLMNQLADKPNNINWGLLLYMNPRIDLLSRAYNKPPSEIAPRAFAESIVEVIANSHLVQSAKNDSDFIKSKPYLNSENSDLQPIWAHHDTDPLLDDLRIAVDYLAPSDVIMFIKQSLAKAELKGKTESEIYDDLIQSLEKWYAELTGRISIWYQKKTKFRLFLMGLSVALVLNVDSLTLFNYFQDNPEAREVMINYYEKNADELVAIDSSDTNILSQTQAYVHQLDSLKTTAELPIGWSKLKIKCPPKDASFIEKSWILSKQWFLKILGLVITAFAASAGAPFWFNLFRRVQPSKTKAS